jgi:UDP-glucose 4-epimerase
MRILITGANGYIGKSLYNALKDKYSVDIITRKECDLTNSSSVDLYFLDKWFDVIIHCAASGAINPREKDWVIMDNNLKIYYNLLKNKNNFNKLINLGSGAEFYIPDTPYGLSKKVVAHSILDKDNFYNLRIFGVFDENELDTRFVKGNIKRYINNEPMIVHQDKIMDFIYMSDLVKIIEYYINNNGPKEINCNYSYAMSLCDIAKTINNLDKHKVDIKIESQEQGEPYISNFENLEIKFIGIEKGIKEVYNKLK